MSVHPKLSLVNQCIPDNITKPIWFHLTTENSNYLLYGDQKLDMGLYEVNSDFDPDKFNESLEQKGSSLPDAVLT